MSDDVNTEKNSQELDKTPSLGFLAKFSIFFFIIQGVSVVFVGYLLFSDSTYVNEYISNPFEAMLFGVGLLTVSYGLIRKKYWSIILLGVGFSYSIIRSIIMFIIGGVLNIYSIFYLIGFIIVKLIWFDYFYLRRKHFN
jgi:hypothetical protein|tara:strand:+ start:60 stop:476 length:417 start_codon:yes stop_codon:yes gene_type:complete